MTIQHIVRRTAASAAAVNTAVACDLPIDSTASTPITSPGGQLIGLAVDVVGAGAEAATTGVVFSVRLSGAGMLEGPQEFSVGFIYIAATSTAFQIGGNQTRIDLLAKPLPLKVNQPITIQVFFNGVDVGSPMVQVELVIES